MATISRRLMERGIAAQAAVSRTPSTEVVSITEEDKDIVEYIAGFAAHRIRQKAFRLKCSGEKTTTLFLYWPEWQLFNVAGYLIEERRRWPVITASPRGQCSK